MKTLNLFTLKKIKSEFSNKKIMTSEDAIDFIKQFYGDDMEIFESCFILLLNRQNMTIGYAKISQGGTVGTIVDVKLICKYAIDSLANSVILAHNHPSGNLNPSGADISITKKVKSALDILDVKLLDHVILTPESGYSLTDSDNEKSQEELCPECNGTGMIEVRDCHDDSSECCGGCFKDVECPECTGEGVFFT